MKEVEKNAKAKKDINAIVDSKPKSNKLARKRIKIPPVKSLSPRFLDLKFPNE